MSTEKERLELQGREVTDGVSSQRYQLGENRKQKEEEGPSSKQDKNPTSSSKGGAMKMPSILEVEKREMKSVSVFPSFVL